MPEAEIFDAKKRVRLSGNFVRLEYNHTGRCFVFHLLIFGQHRNPEFFCDLKYKRISAFQPCHRSQ